MLSVVQIGWTAGGAMIGNEAYLSGFNVQLAGGVDLVRDPRNGRNFEYAGEDPLLAGVIVGSEIKGIQSNPVISTVKHYAFNDQETNRNSIDVKIGDQAGRTSDLLAFQIAIETGHPGAVMCAYNRVNGSYACESDYLLNQVLKTDWRYPGYVMSDWGAVHSTIPAANNGLDQESAFSFDVTPYFGEALREAVLDGHVSPARLDDMDHRILRSMFETGLFDHPVAGDQASAIDYAGHLHVAQADAEEAIVLLKNRGRLLPLAASAKRIAIIGGHADVGVLSGGGSAQVYPRGGMAVPNEGAERLSGARGLFPVVAVEGDKGPPRGRCDLCRRQGYRRRDEGGGRQRYRHRLRHPVAGRKLRRAEPSSAQRPGRSDRRRGQGQSQHCSGAGDRRPGRHALGRSGRRDRRGLVSRLRRRRGHRPRPDRRGRRLRPPADDLSPGRSPATAVGGGRRRGQGRRRPAAPHPHRL